MSALPQRGRRGPRPPRPLTADRLEKAALAYLERFSSSAETLRRVLRRRVERAVRAGVGERAQGLALVEDTVTKMLRLGLVDDRRFAEGKVAALRRAGRSTRGIRLALASKGIDSDLIADALGEPDEAAHSELAAAIAHARKRRIGPFRPAAERRGARTRDLAAMARAGFGYALARRVVEAASVEALEADGEA